LDVGTRHEVTVFDGCLRDIKYLDFGTLSALLICMRIPKMSNFDYIIVRMPPNGTQPQYRVRLIDQVSNKVHSTVYLPTLLKALHFCEALQRKQTAEVTKIVSDLDNMAQ
jgi:hypothetical protein